jgi:hypothetical protein
MPVSGGFARYLKYKVKACAAVDRTCRQPESQ